MREQQVALVATDAESARQWQPRLAREANGAWGFVVEDLQERGWLPHTDAVCMLADNRAETVSRWLGDLAGQAATLELPAPPVLLLVPAETEAAVARIAYSGPWDYRVREPLSPAGVLFGLRRLVGEAGRRQQAALCRQRLTAANEDIEYLAHLVAHDIKAPLRITAKFLELLNLRHADQLQESAREYVELAVSNAGKAQQMIDALRIWSRIVWHPDGITEVDLDGLWEEVLDERREELEGIGAEVSVEALPSVPGHQEQLRQLFRHVLDNAIRYRGEEGLELRICADAGERELILTVEDNGLGLEPEMCRFAFELFQRFHPEASTGTGSGLAYCKRIATLHGGRTWLDSSPDHGTTFYLVLPTQQASTLPS